MFTRLRAVAILMSSVFLLMSACLLIQAQASHDDVPSCHASAPDKNTPDKFEMGRCCQAGILKSQDHLISDFQDLKFIPLTPQQAHLTFLYFYPHQGSFHDAGYPRAGDRLAELSVLRI